MEVGEPWGVLGKIRENSGSLGCHYYVGVEAGPGPRRVP